MGKKTGVKISNGNGNNNLNTHHDDNHDRLPNQETNIIQQVKRVIILGAGVSGAAVVDELVKTVDMPKDQMVILEKRDRIGGKLYTNKTYNTELGGVVLTANYRITETLAKHQIPVERLFDTNQTSLNQALHHTDKPSLLQQAVFAAKLGWQIMVFAKENFLYQWFSRSPSTADFDLTFRAFVEKKNLHEISRFLDVMGAGMGYGDQADRGNYAFKWLNYMGYMTIPFLTFGSRLSGRNLVRPQGGYQNVVERMYDGYDVRLSASIDSIERSERGVTLQYHDENNQRYQITADLLVTTMSPYYWPKIQQFELSAAERHCVEALRYYEYPIAICAIEGYPAEQIFVPPALKREGFGHVAFIFTADNREQPEGGRICQVFINLPQEARGYSLAEGSAGREAMFEDLRQLGYEHVRVLDFKVWHDYHPSIPRELSLALEHEEDVGKYRTLHVGTFKHDSFDYVSSAEVSARQRVQTYLRGRPSLLRAIEEAPSIIYGHLRRAYTFFTMPIKEPARELPSVQQEAHDAEYSHRPRVE